MNRTTILIICGFFAVSFLLMIPAYYYQKKLKNKESGFVENNKRRAVLRLYASKVKINGKSLKEYDCSIGKDMECLVALEPGSYQISGKYTLSDIAITGNQKYETPTPVSIDVKLERGEIYTLGISAESPCQVEGEEEMIAMVPLAVSGLFAKHKELYLACYRDIKVTKEEYNLKKIRN